MSDTRKSFAICILKEDTNNKPYIFECPTFSLQVDDWVKVETRRGSKQATVIAVLDFADEETETFLKTYVKRTEFKKVISKISEKELEYDE